MIESNVTWKSHEWIDETKIIMNDIEIFFLLTTDQQLYGFVVFLKKNFFFVPLLFAIVRLLNEGCLVCYDHQNYSCICVEVSQMYTQVYKHTKFQASNEWKNWMSLIIHQNFVRHKCLLFVKLKLRLCSTNITW